LWDQINKSQAFHNPKVCFGIGNTQKSETDPNEIEFLELWCAPIVQTTCPSVHE